MLEKLKDIKICPDCKCKKIESFRKYSLHSNGHWNEEIKFECGYIIQFSPNFMKNVVTGECQKSLVALKRTSIRHQFILDLQVFAANHKKVDQKFKDKMIGIIVDVNAKYP